MEKTAIEQKFLPRGPKARLPHGGLPEVISLYLLDLIEKTGGATGPIGLQFIAQPLRERRHFKSRVFDPLFEDLHEVAPGLVYKYFGRALWTITRSCATYCRFCTRGREVGLPAPAGLPAPSGRPPNLRRQQKAAMAQSPYLTDGQLNQVIDYLKTHPEINEVIISGGDPLTVPQSYLENIVDRLLKLQAAGQLTIIRFGTRLPIHNPSSIRDWHYDLLARVVNPYLMIHVNHPLELTDLALSVLRNFRQISFAQVLSQSVLLKGINDDPRTLYQLFTKMAANGIRPYYVYQNDPVYWAKHFTVPPSRAVKIWQKLRPRLSGLAATARFVIDTPYGHGKVAVPEGDAWSVDFKSFRDFKGKTHRLN